MLVAGTIDLGRRSQAPFALLDALAERRRFVEPLTAWHCCLEFFSVTTRLPEEYRLTPGTALRLLEEEIFGRLAVFGLPDGARRDFLRQTVDAGVAGGAVYDAHVAAVARRSGARWIVTENRRHFARLLREPIRVVGSSELLAELEAEP